MYRLDALAPNCTAAARQGKPLSIAETTSTMIEL
jgi:hypothetical protein